MSLLVEHLLFWMWQAEQLDITTAFVNAVEKGIQARQGRAIGDGRRKDKGQSGEEMSARVVLEMSGERISMLVGMMKGDTAAGADGVDGGGMMPSSSQLSELTPTPESRSEDSLASS
jgi:hypothetical protein